MNLTRFRPSKPSAASVLVTVALVVTASAGSAFAASQITGKDVKDGSLTGADLKNGSVGLKDLASSARVPGPKGDLGAQGPAGERGPAGTAGAAASAPQAVRVDRQPNGSLAKVPCPSGTTLIGGGFRAGNSNSRDFSVISNGPDVTEGPDSAPNTWRVELKMNSNAPAGGTAGITRAWAYCLKG